MLDAQIASILFPEREDNTWGSSSLFREDIPAAAGPSQQPPIVLVDTPAIQTDEPAPIAPTPPSPLALSELTWETAAKDSAEGVHYVREGFPSESSTYLAAPFRKEPIAVAAGDRVAVLEELSEYAVRVRSLRDGAVGVVPTWNIEDALERLARLNMELNEIVTSPASSNARGLFATTLFNSTFLYTRRPGLEVPGSPSATSDDDMEADLPATPTTPATVPRIRRVEFAHAPQKTVFRYVAPGHMGDTDDEAWWDGWEEREGGCRPEDGPFGLPDEAEDSMDAGAEAGRLGRPRLRRTDAYMG